MTHQKLILAIFIFLTACSSTSERPPSPDLNDHLQNSHWSLQSLDLKLKDFKGTCDFSKIHPESIQDASYDEKEGVELIVKRLYDSEPEGCRFQLLGADGVFTPASGIAGTFRIRITGTAEIQLQHQVGNQAPPTQARGPANESLKARCTHFETNGRISQRKKVVTCYLPHHQGTIRLEEM
ncbi:MAG: hypothetical protein ACAH59_03045 [Pseudobdellovibrionaceae bacterium]